MTISPTDIAVLAAYLAAVLLFGLWVGRGAKTASDYFLGNRTLPWPALLLSIVATETSTVTFLSIPGLAAAAAGNMTFLQITIGYIAGRLLVVAFLLPMYFEGKIFTAYEVLQKRFGRLSRRLVSMLFLLTRNTSDALRLFLTALVLQVVVGLDLTLSVFVIAAVTIVYTLIGGAKSVIWNDCVQFVVYTAGALAAIVILAGLLPGGLLAYGSSTGRLQLFDFSPTLTGSTMTFWAGLVGGAFLTAATHGTDQLMVQRYLSTSSRRDAGLALGLSGFIVLLQFGLFLLIGVGLAGLAATGAPVPNRGDQMFAWFIVEYMPVGLLGLTLAAVFAAAMSTLSSSLNASAAALVNDLIGQRDDESATTRIARWSTLGFGLLQAGLAVLFGLSGTEESTVALVLKVAGFAAGPVLGLYVFALAVPDGDERSALTGFVSGIVMLSIIAMTTSLYWAWYAAVGAILCLAASYAATLVYPQRATA